MLLYNIIYIYISVLITWISLAESWDITWGYDGDMTNTMIIRFVQEGGISPFFFCNVSIPTLMKNCCCLLYSSFRICPLLKYLP